MRLCLIALLVMTSSNPELAAQGRNQARSVVISQQGIAATSQTLASQAGAHILARGGSAIDAAIAANAVLSVVEPMSCGLGGDLFAIYWEAKTGKLYGINASGWAPKGLTLDFLKAKGFGSMPQDGIHSVTVPGAVDGWKKLHQRFGKARWADLFQPAIYYANQGFPVTEWIQDAWRSSHYKLSRDEYARKVFLPNNEAPGVGQVFRNPDLGKALSLIAAKGPDAFYKGAIAEGILKTSARLEGALTATDLAEFQAEWVDPIHTTYRGWTVYELPPNSQGIAALEMLNMLEQFPLGDHAFDSPEAFHLKIESQKLAYQDLKAYLADPRQAKVPLPGLLSKGYATERARLIDASKARCDVDPGKPPYTAGDTIYLSTVDKEGNIASLIQSVYLSFGSGVAVDGYGFHLHNRAGLFEMDPAHPNVVAGRKRPFHTIIPAFMEKDDLRIGFGIMGGLNQAQAHVQFVTNIVDHQMNIQAAMEAARFTKLNFSGCDVMLENRVAPATVQALSAKGHQLEMQAEFSMWMGGGQAVQRNLTTKVNSGSSDPRKDGAAVPEPDPWFAPKSR